MRPFFWFRKITFVAVPFLGLTTVVLTVFMLITLIDFPLYRSQHLEVCYYFNDFMRLRLPTKLGYSTPPAV